MSGSDIQTGARCDDAIAAARIHAGSESALSTLRARSFEPLFVAHWDRVAFFHFAVEPSKLQDEIPFQLDTQDGQAYVTLVAFTMSHMRLHWGGAVGSFLCKPISTHHFLNVRTYVRHRGEPGIYFIREWLSSRICVRLGPTFYGLPYRFARIDYEHDHERGTIRGTVHDPIRNKRVEYLARLDSRLMPGSCAADPRTEFLLERYIAVTARKGRLRLFRIWHAPWEQVPIECEFSNLDLVSSEWPWWKHAKFACAHYSPGVRNVEMGWPHRVHELTTPHRGALTSFFEFP